MRFKFTATDEQTAALLRANDDLRRDYRMRLEFSADSLPEILSEFECFLRGAGFCPDGRLEFLEESTPEAPREH